MAVIGDAYVVVRAITTNVLPDIQKGLNGIGSVGQSAGKDLGDGINAGLANSQARTGFNNLRDRLEASRLQFRALNNAARFLGPAITGVVGAIGALVGGLIVLVAAAGNAARALIVLPATLVALGQALITTRLLLGGIAEAFQAKINAQKQSGAANKAEEAALKRLRDARLALKRLIEEEAPEELARARERAADAARSAADALLSAERTQRSYNDAQKATLDATNDLSEARERAVEKLQQLRFQVEGAAISEARARLEFEKARDSLQAVQDLPPNSRARQEAELAFAQAELNLRKAIDNNADLKKEEDAATKAGVEGSEDVLAAKEALARAQEREADLAIDTARAFERAAEAQRDAAQAAAAAAAGGTVERELIRRIAEAREAVREAEAAAADAAAAGNNAYAESLKYIGEEGKIFLEVLDRVRTKLLEIRRDFSGPLFIGLTSALETFEGALPALAPMFEKTGGIIGDFADKLSTALFTGEGFESLKNVWSTNDELLENLGTAAVNLALAFLLILEAAEPLITAFGEWAASSSAQFLADLRSDAEGLDEVFSNAQRNFGLFSEIIGNVLEAFGVIGGVINEEGGAGQTLLEGLRDRSEDWLQTLKDGAADGSLDTLFQGLVENFLQLFDLAYELGRVFLEIGAQPGIGQFIESIKNAVTTFGEIGVSLSGEDGPVAKLGEFVEKIALLTQALTDSDSLSAFFTTLNTALGYALEIFTSQAFQDFFQKWGPVIAQVAAFGLIFRAIRLPVEAFLGIVLLAFSPFLALAALIKTGIGGGLAAVVSGPLGQIFFLALRLFSIFGLIVGLVALAWQNSEYFRTAVSEVWEGIKGAFSEVFQTIKNVIDEIQPSLALAGETFGDIFGTLVYIIGPVIEIIVKIIGGAIAVIISLFAGVLDAVTFIWYGIKGIIQGVAAIFTGDWDTAIASFKKAWEGLKGFLKNVVGIIFRPVFQIINRIIDAWNNMARNLVIRVPDWVPFIGGGTFQLPQIPRIPIPDLAMGGIVKATYGGTLARIGEAGRPERIEPLDPDGLSKRDKAMIDRLTGGGAGATINVYPSPGMDERELADLVSRKLAYQMRRGSV